jgi:hypothetical protein
MASIIKEVRINSSADDVWKVIGDFATGPSRMARGYVVDTRVDGDHRIVTFADGAVVRERFVSVDDNARRIVYAIVDGSLQPAHDNAAMQVIADDDRGCRLVWIHDVLPDDLAVHLETSMTRGIAVIKQTLESATTSA